MDNEKKDPSLDEVFNAMTGNGIVGHIEIDGIRRVFFSLTPAGWPMCKDDAEAAFLGICKVVFMSYGKDWYYQKKDDGKSVSG